MGHTQIHRIAILVLTILFAQSGIAEEDVPPSPKTPLLNAIFMGHVDEVKEILAKDKNAIKEHDAFGQGVLHTGSDATITQILVDAGANVNARDEQGETPLMHASEENAAMVKILLDHGADVNARDEHENTALHGAWKGGKDVVALLVDKGADVNATNSSGRTPLFNLARSKTPEAMDVLIAKGADVKARDDYQTTPMHEAAQDGNAACVEYLIAKGADPLAKNKAGESPLHYAAKGKYRWSILGEPSELDAGYVKVIQILRSKGADPNEKSSAGESAIDIAKTRSTSEQILEMMNRKLAEGKTD